MQKRIFVTFSKSKGVFLSIFFDKKGWFLVTFLEKKVTDLNVNR